MLSISAGLLLLLLDGACVVGDADTVLVGGCGGGSVDVVVVLDVALVCIVVVVVVLDMFAGDVLVLLSYRL